MATDTPDTDNSSPMGGCDPVWRIAKWTETFERAESRKLKTLTWIAMPTGFASTGYQSMLEEFEDDAPAIYGAWVALCAFASTCHVRGVLGNSRGIPLKLSHIARVVGFPEPLFRRLVAWASRTDVGWLEPISSAALSQELTKNAGIPIDSTTSGDSPDDLPAVQENPPSTRPNRTEPNRTVPNRTGQDQTIDRSIESRGIETGDWVERSKGGLFWDRVVETADRLLRAGKGRIDRDMVWQAAWVGVAIDRDAIEDATTYIAEGKANKPKAFLGACMVRLCQSHDSDWDRLKRQVPPAPPPPPARVQVEPDSVAV
jgi:hypothetical protein